MKNAWFVSWFRVQRMRQKVLRTRLFCRKLKFNNIDVKQEHCTLNRQELAQHTPRILHALPAPHRRREIAAENCRQRVHVRQMKLRNSATIRT